MTATAFAADPILDYSPGHGRPQLRVIHGHGDPRPPARPPAAGCADPAAAPRPVELYRRRRFIALLVVTTVVLAITYAAGISIVDFSPAAAADTGQAAPAVHVVRPGDTYHAIAASLGAGDGQVVADELRAANGGGELVVGQRLILDLKQLTSVGGGSAPTS